jgi:hypothetical protein
VSWIRIPRFTVAFRVFFVCIICWVTCILGLCRCCQNDVSFQFQNGNHMPRDQKRSINWNVSGCLHPHAHIIKSDACTCRGSVAAHHRHGPRPGIDNAGPFVLDLQYVMQPRGPSNPPHVSVRHTADLALWWNTKRHTKTCKFPRADVQYVHTGVVEGNEDCR